MLEFARSRAPTTPMATALAPVDARDVVKCDMCGLVQFPASNNLCRRCRVDLDAEHEPVAARFTAPLPLMMTAPVIAPGPGGALAASLKSLRRRSGLSQRQ